MGITPNGFQWAIAVLKSLFPGTTGLKRHFPQEKPGCTMVERTRKLGDRSSKLNLIAARFIVHGG
jgi:hypothetical protein